MAIKIYTKIQEQGIAEGHPQSGMMEYGYGQYVNAFVIDTEFQIDGADDGNMGMYATERVSFDASDEQISRARRRARDRARGRYRRERAAI